MTNNKLYYVYTQCLWEFKVRGDCSSMLMRNH